MKKQNTNNKLAFNKAAVSELNNIQLMEINGGTGDLIEYLVRKAGFGTWYDYNVV